MIYIVLATLLFVAYNIAVIAAVGIPKSLSDTYYTDIGSRWLQPLYLSLCTLIGTAGFTAVRKEWEWTIFLALCGLVFVTVTPKSRDDFQSPIHLGAAITAAVATQLFALVHTPQTLWLWLLYPLLCFYKSKSAVYWAEIVCFTTLIMALGIILSNVVGK